MIISCLGDSLTEGDYGIFGKTGIANVHEKNYPYFLAKSTNAEVRNFGKCGFAATSYLDFYNTGAVKTEDADIVIIMLGTNGGFDTKNTDATGNIDYITLVNKCLADVKGRVVLCTPPHATENPKMSNCGYAGNVENAAVCIRKIAEDKHLPIIDIARSALFTAENEAIMQPNDGLHFGETGYKTLAGFIEQELKRILPEFF